MPYTKITNDKETRETFKLALKETVEKALSPVVQESPETVDPVRVLVPVNFNSLPKGVLYGIFTREQFLTPDQANEVLEILEGKTSDQFTIILQGQIEKEVEATPEPLATETKQVDLVLPRGFETFKSFDQYLWLAKESGLTLSYEEINDVIDILKGKPALTGTEFNISFADHVVIFEEETFSASQELDNEELSSEEPIIVTFPLGYENMRDSDIHHTLTHNSEFACNQEKATLALDYYSGAVSVSNIELRTVDGKPILPRK